MIAEQRADQPSLSALLMSIPRLKISLTISRLPLLAAGFSHDGVVIDEYSLSSRRSVRYFLTASTSPAEIAPKIGLTVLGLNSVIVACSRLFPELNVLLQFACHVL